MNKFLLLLLPALFLSGCNVEDISKVCAAKDAVYSSWTTYSTAVGVSEKTADRVNVAYDLATSTCLNPPTDTISGLVTVTNAAAIIAIELKNVKKQGDAKGVAMPVVLQRVMNIR